MKTLLAFFGLICLLILTFLTGGLAMIVALAYSAPGREGIKAAIKELLYPKEVEDDDRDI
jgi:hypothetical protein